MKKLGLSLAIAAAVGLSACGGSSGSGSSTSASGTTISGSASKGIVISGLVSAYLFDVNGIPETEAIATAITDSTGDYSLSIPAEHAGKPVYIVVDDNDGAASMKCDIAGGCDPDGDPLTDNAVAFGETLDLAAGDLEMTAVLPEVAAEVSVNVTPLTTVAAAVATDAISAGVVNDFNIQEAVNNANSQVAERFGLMDDITQIPVVDLTDAADVAATIGGDAEAVQYAAINAAIISAVQADGTDVSIDAAIESFAEDFVDNGLTDNSVDGTITDLGDILEDASDVIDEVVTIVTEELEGDDSLTDLADLGTAIDDDQTDADAEDPTDEGDQGTPSDTANATNLAQVKAFVEELRELGTAIDSSLIGEGDGAQTVETILDNFDLQVDAADMASSDDVDQAFEALGLAVEAMVEVYVANFDEETGELLVIGPDNDATLEAVPGVVNFEGIDVNVSEVEGKIVLAVEEGITVDGFEDSVAVNASTTLNAMTIDDETTLDEVTETTWADAGMLTATVDLDIAGTASVGAILVTVGADAEGNESGIEGSVVIDWHGEGAETNDQSGNSGTYDDYADFHLTNFDMQLNVDIAQTESQEVGGPMTFAGEVQITLNNTRLIEDLAETWSYDSETGDQSNTDDETLTLTLDMLDLRMAGTFGNDDSSFDAVFTLSGDASGVTFTDVYNFESSWSETQGHTQSDSSETTGETPSSYADLAMTLAFSAELDGVADDEIDFDFTVERTGYDDVDASVSLSYPGRTIAVEASVTGLDTEDSAMGSLTLTNNDGVTISLEADETAATEAEELSGTVTVGDDDTIYATFDLDGSIERIVYSDGTFESLF